MREFFEPLAHWRRTRAAPPLAGSASQRLLRVQIGLFGLVCMIMLIGLADIVIRRAQMTEASVVDPVIAAPPPAEAAERRDPLAEAGVVPGIEAQSAPRQNDPPGAMPGAMPGDAALGDLPPPGPANARQLRN